MTGFTKNNSYRAWGDYLTAAKDVNEPFFAGTFRAGLWYEQISNDRAQQFIDYTTGVTYDVLGAAAGIPANASYKLNLTSNIKNVQPFVEYEWRPTKDLTITPGYKFESFTRQHSATVNQTSLLPINYTHTYTANLPFLTVRYMVMPELAIYAQASKGFLAPTVSAYYVANPSKNHWKLRLADRGRLTAPQTANSGLCQSP